MDDVRHVAGAVLPWLAHVEDGDLAAGSQRVELVDADLGDGRAEEAQSEASCDSRRP